MNVPDGRRDYTKDTRALGDRGARNLQSESWLVAKVSALNGRNCIGCRCREKEVVVTGRKEWGR